MIYVNLCKYNVVGCLETYEHFVHIHEKALWYRDYL